jgi:tetratricopeptide (TPR) repeat protein
MKFALILMIKNESRILRRCLKAIEEFVDYFCICDTGSTDNTCEIANTFLETHEGCLTHEPFINFGYNRTISFLNARQFLIKKNCNLSETYGLLLDADMLFVPNKLKEYPLTEVGYKIIQQNGDMEYYNTRIIRMDFKWKCYGVTHEYWGGTTAGLIPKDICYILDHNDGGCKTDKFERDVRLLNQGLVDEPNNERYVFYLAQSYKCIMKYEDSIEMYKKRIALGGWYEEVWYSHYMIGECYYNLKNIPEFEKWMQLAHCNRPCRAESIYKLAKHFREVGEHYKSYHYIKLGQSIPFPVDDILFIETNVYKGLFDYEASIVEYYIHKERCLKQTVKYMLKLSQFQENCLSNLKFSVQPIPCVSTKLDLPLVFDDEFRPSAISVCEYPMANVRYVNYWIENGSYFTKDSVPVQTYNAYVNLETNEVVAKMLDSSINLEKFETNVRGLEDIRLFTNDNKLQFTATSVREYQKDVLRVIMGDYNTTNGNYDNVRILNPPTDNNCEKNWLPIKDTNTFIYGWHPYTIVDDNVNTIKVVQTPPLFNLFRGSAPPIQYNDGWLSLVHLVEYSTPRNYYHCFVKLDNDFLPKNISLPFVFKSISIEYCVSIRLNTQNTVECYVSFMDKNPHKISINTDDISWISI